MLESLLSPTPTKILENALSASALRQKIISNNIANVNTPKFKKSDVLFENILQEAMSGSKMPLSATNARHIAITKNSSEVVPVINTDTNTSMRTDGNNVDIDIEMAELAKNSIYYDAVTQQISKYFSNLKSVINGGK